MAAWVSHDTDSEERLDNRKQVKGLINFLYRNKHLSPFEHGIFKFKVDVPLFVAREFHRHRTWSYNEVSGRYTEMKPRFYVPPRERPLVQEGKAGNYYFTEGSDEQYALVLSNIRNSTRDSYTYYERMLSHGIAKEVARDVLPLNLMTQFYATTNPRNLMQFLTLRNEDHALYEIRQVAVEMEKYLAELMPFTYEAFRPETEHHSIPVNQADAREVGEIVVSLQKAFERRKHVTS
jgi:thymidylate synthase (FAD)